MGITIFIAGAYGTGKSILCGRLSTIMQIPFFSAGDLISEINGEHYGANKAATDKNRNQILLADKVQELNQIYSRIILAGHFCIFNNSNEVETLPASVFYNLNIEQIVLLEANEDIIAKHLQKRDGKEYSFESIHQLIIAERKQSKEITNELNCRLCTYQMTFSDEDACTVINFLRKGDYYASFA